MFLFGANNMQHENDIYRTVLTVKPMFFFLVIRGAFDLEDYLYMYECPTTMFRSQQKYRAVRPVLTRWSRNGFQDRFLPTVRDKCESFVLKVSCQG